MNKFLLILLILSSTGASAALNKWVDANGQVHYSDLPPPNDVEATKLRSSSGIEDPANRNDTAASAPAAPKSMAEREAELKKAQQEKKAAAEKSAKDQANAEAIKASCAATKQYLRTLQDGIRMVTVDANGERSYMDDEQRQQNITKVQQDINRDCK